MDVSVIHFGNVSIDLSLHYILLYGHSWYNKYGYYSDGYADELVNNQLFVTRTLQHYRDDNQDMCDAFIFEIGKFYGAFYEAETVITYETTIRAIVVIFDSLLKIEFIDHGSLITMTHPLLSLLQENVLYSRILKLKVHDESTEEKYYTIIDHDDDDNY